MYAFGDSFDLYALLADVGTYWDTFSATNMALVAGGGRFPGGQCVRNSAGNSTLLTRNGANDAVHHLNFAYNSTDIISPSTEMGFTLFDWTTAQCTVDFTVDGSLELRSGTISGTVLATWPRAYNGMGAWFTYEIEVVISSTAGSITVRRNGNPSNDFTATGLNTRGGTANNYANRLSVVTGPTTGTALQLDDFLWRSDPSSVPWIGDVRCYTRRPSADAAIQFTKSPAAFTQTPYTFFNTVAIAAGTARYAPFLVNYTGTLGTVSVILGAGYTGNMKCSLFNVNASSQPTTVIASATSITNPATGYNFFTFPSPPSVVAGTAYAIGFDSDTASGTFQQTAANSGFTSPTAYASFPAANPTPTAAGAPIITAYITGITNTQYVTEAQQDLYNSYVYDSVVGQSDLYNIAASVTPAGTVTAVTTRGFMMKSDFPTSLGGAVQLKSGATTALSTLELLSTNFTYLYRTDLTDPNTGSAWTAANVNSVQIGPYVSETMDILTLIPPLDSRITFTRATIGTYFDASGTLVTAPTGAPRFDWDPIAHTAKGLLIEEARTNLCLQSGNIANAVWSKSGSGVAPPTITANVTTAPDGTVSAASVAYPAVSTASNFSLFSQGITATAAPYVFSVYLRGNAGGEVTYLSASPDGVTYQRQQVTLTTSWQRYSLTTTNLTAATWFFEIGTDRRDAAQAATSAQTIYAWGAQIEASAFPTSYIPTAASTVTRNADQASMPVPSLFGNGAFSFAFEWDSTKTAGTPVQGGLSDGSFSNTIYLSGAGSGCQIGGVGQDAVGGAGVVSIAGALNKSAISYGSGGIQMVANNTTVGNATSQSPPFVWTTRMGIGCSPWGLDNQIDGHIRRVRYWNRALSSGELVSVTT